MGQTETAAGYEGAAPALRKPTHMLFRSSLGASLIAGLAVVFALDTEWEAGFVYAAVTAMVVTLALSEFARLADALGAEVNHSLLVLSGLTLFLLQWAGHVSDAFPDPWLAGTSVLCVVIMGLFLGRVLSARIEGALQGIALTAAGLIHIPLLMGFLTATRARWGVAGFVTVVVVCKAGAVGAYVIGRWFGRRPLAPVVSPRKTVAGAVGCVAACVAAAYALSLPGWAIMGPRAALVFGLAVALSATAGDLTISLAKRQAGLKDSGHLLPGFGGMLDMVDDLLFSAPVAFFLLSGFELFPI